MLRLSGMKPVKVCPLDDESLLDIEKMEMGEEHNSFLALSLEKVTRDEDAPGTGSTRCAPARGRRRRENQTKQQRSTLNDKLQLHSVGQSMAKRLNRAAKDPALLKLDLPEPQTVVNNKNGLTGRLSRNPADMVLQKQVTPRREQSTSKRCERQRRRRQRRPTKQEE